MKDFEFQNKTKIVFGKGKIAQLAELVDLSERVLLLYGGGSIRKNGVYDQVKRALAAHQVDEFEGIEANPQYTTCLRAVDAIRKHGTKLLLAVGGGSVIDAAKFIAVAAASDSDDPWQLILGDEPIKAAMPIGSVLTLPATGSEMNGNSVISRKEIKEKRPFGSNLVLPRFSILDPETTFSLPERQISNGIVDAFVHTTEQYLTYPINAAIQDRFAEGILLTLIEEGPKALANPLDYDTRANIMWAATLALNGLISAGAVSDWATHMIGHEITAFYGLDHARTLAIVLPGVWKHEFHRKLAKLAQYGRRVWGLSGDDESVAETAIEKTEEFFSSVGIGTTLASHNVPAAAVDLVADRFVERGSALGEHDAIDGEATRKILTLQIA